MNAEQMHPTKSCQSGTANWRQGALFLAIMFISAGVCGAIGGGIGAVIYGPYPADWGVAAGVGFAVGAGLVSCTAQRWLLDFVNVIDSTAATDTDR